IPTARRLCRCGAGMKRPRFPGSRRRPSNIFALTWRPHLSAKATDIQLVVFDWAGTTIDHGSLAPLAAFIEAFAQHDVAVSAEEARGPMGLHKKDHIRTMLEMPAVAQRWRQA